MLELVVSSLLLIHAAVNFHTLLALARECLNKAQKRQAINRNQRCFETTERLDFSASIKTKWICRPSNVHRRAASRRSSACIGLGPYVGAVLYSRFLALLTWRCHHSITSGFLNLLRDYSSKLLRSLLTKRKQRCYGTKQMEENEILAKHLASRGQAKRKERVSRLGYRQPAWVNEDRLRDAIILEHLLAFPSSVGAMNGVHNEE